MMRLDPSDLVELAPFFAKRFASTEHREALAQRVGLEVDPTEGWAVMLMAAQEAGLLVELVRQAAREDREDDNLQQLLVLLGGRERRWKVPPYALAGAAIAGFMLVLGTGTSLLWAAGAFPDTSTGTDGLALHDAPVAAGNPQVDLVAIQGATAGAGQTKASPKMWADNPLDAAKAAKEAPTTTEAVVEAAPEPAPVAQPAAMQSAHHKGRCTTADQGIVGYWYAGDAAPGARGATITIDAWVNVRADYPDTHNGFEKRAPVRCALRPGDRVKLSAAPILVPGDRYWVPLRSGDLLGTWSGSPE